MESKMGDVTTMVQMNAGVRFYGLMQLSLELDGKGQQEILDVPEAEPGQVNAFKTALQ